MRFVIGYIDRKYVLLDPMTLFLLLIITLPTKRASTIPSSSTHGPPQLATTVIYAAAAAFSRRSSSREADSSIFMLDNTRTHQQHAIKYSPRDAMRICK